MGKAVTPDQKVCGEKLLLSTEGVGVSSRGAVDGADGGGGREASCGRGRRRCQPVQQEPQKDLG